jgi:molybdopterin molybdotransferase
MTRSAYPQSINYSQALKLVQQASQLQQLPTEQITVQQAHNRVLASAITAEMNVPEYDCSQVDGFAVNYEFLRDKKPTSLQLNQAVYAGENGNGASCTELATPIMTGALLPSGCDAVVMKEHAVVKDNAVKIEQFISKNQNVRKAGTDLKKGQVILKKNHALTANDLGLLSSVGLIQVVVFQKPKVALMMTGNELLQAGEKRIKGHVYDANSLMLKTILTQLGCEVSLLNTLVDEKEIVTQRLFELKNDAYDFIVSVGGVSMGDKDWLPETLLDQGEIIFHKCRVKPGFPMLFGRLGKALYFGLPGNPVSAFSGLFQFVYPALLSMLGMSRTTVLSWYAVLLQDVPKTHFRREFLRGRFNMTAKGTMEVMVCGSQQSSRIQSLSEANCMIVLNESQQDLKQGELVSIQPFSQLNCLGE